MHFPSQKKLIFTSKSSILLDSNYCAPRNSPLRTVSVRSWCYMQKNSFLLSAKMTRNLLSFVGYEMLPDSHDQFTCRQQINNPEELNTKLKQQAKAYFLNMSFADNTFASRLLFRESYFRWIKVTGICSPWSSPGAILITAPNQPLGAPPINVSGPFRRRKDKYCKTEKFKIVQRENMMDNLKKSLKSKVYNLSKRKKLNQGTVN